MKKLKEVDPLVEINAPSASIWEDEYIAAHQIEKFENEAITSCPPPIMNGYNGVYQIKDLILNRHPTLGRVPKHAGWV